MVLKLFFLFSSIRTGRSFALEKEVVDQARDGEDERRAKDGEEELEELRHSHADAFEVPDAMQRPPGTRRWTLLH